MLRKTKGKPIQFVEVDNQRQNQPKNQPCFNRVSVKIKTTVESHTDKSAPPLSQQPTRQILVCQHRTCRKQGAAKVLAAFQALPVNGVTVSGSPCLGECGNGPMVVVLLEETWYCRVHPDEVPTVVQRHIKDGQPVKAMLYRKYH